MLSPEGVFDVTKTQESKLFNPTQQIPLILICDNVRDPGNMGTLIRCAAAAGCKMLVTTPGIVSKTPNMKKSKKITIFLLLISDCVDVWDAKVLRAAAGAHFRIKMSLGVEWDVIPGNIVAQGTTVILADSSIQKNSVFFEDKDYSNTKLLEKGADSGPKSRTVEILEGGSMQQRDSSYLDAQTLRMYRKLPLPHFAYDELPIDSSGSIALVIGGETHGLSSAAHKLAHDYGGFKVL